MYKSVPYTTDSTQSCKRYSILLWMLCLSMISFAQTTNLPVTQLEKQNAMPPTLEPFECVPNFYQTVGNTGLFVRYNVLDFAEGFDTITTLGIQVNALAYHPATNYMYAIQASNKHLIKIGLGGDFEDLGAVGLSGSIFVGEIGADGTYYVKGGGNNVYIVDIDGLSSTSITTTGTFGAADWAYNYVDDKIYGVGGTTLYAFDPATNVVTTNSLTGFLPGETTGFGASFYTVDGSIYIHSNGTGNIYLVNIASNSVSYIITGPNNLSINDGASCPFALPPFPVLYAENDTAYTTIDLPVDISIKDNDDVHFAIIDNASFMELTPPQNGSATWDSNTETLTYTPNPDFYGIDSLQYKFCDQVYPAFCDDAWVYIYVSPVTFLDESICDGESYFFDNQFLTESGIYHDTLSTYNGVDSLLQLDLMVLQTFETNLTESICEGETFQVGNSTYNQSGNYTDILTAANSCDSTVNLNLTVLPIFTTDLVESICEGESFQVGNLSYSQSGNYSDILTAQNGCDSTVNLNLTVLPIFTTDLVESICEGESFQVGNLSYSQSGNYTDILTAQNGCDSTVNLNLTVLPIFETDLVESICEGESFQVGNLSYSQSGNYSDILTAQNGCDSTVNLNLTVLPIFTTDLVESICEGESFQVGNLSYSQSGNYSDILTAQNGCDSTVNLNLTVLPFFTTDLVESICDGESFQVGNLSYSQSGNYSDILTAQNGCDSTVNLNLTVLPFFTTDLVESICEGESFQVGNLSYSQSGNYSDILTAQNGCDSTVNLNLTVLPFFTTDLVESICDGESFQVGNLSYSQSGNYSDILTAQNGCDSMVNLSLTVLPTFTTDLVESICEGESFQVGNLSYSQSGNYSDILTAQNGCDSTVNLNLTVLPIFTTDLVESICEGESFQVGNLSYSQSGNYSDVLTAANGCDSTVNLNLTVLPIFTTDLVESICDGESFQVGNLSYSQSGNYSDILTAQNGCDSTVNLNLTVLPFFTTDLVESICDGESFQVGNLSYSQSGNYSDILTAQNGCDSTVNLNLTVLPHSSTTLNEIICDEQSVTVGSTTFSVSGNYEVTLPAANGCDSVIVLNLTVLDNDFTELNETICEGESYTIGTSIYTVSGNYIDTLAANNGCNSIIYLNLTVLPVFETNLVESICDGETFQVGNSIYNHAGNYTDILTAVNGCDSTVNLSLTILPVYTTNLVEGICQGESFQIGNSFYDETGIYTENLLSTAGCDSIVNLNLTVHATTLTDIDAEICDGEFYAFNGNNYFQSDDYGAVFTSQFGCDSVVILHLQVNPNIEITLNEGICEGETFPLGDNDYSESGTYTENFIATGGCDSLVTLNLTVYPNETTNLVAEICNGEFVEIDDAFYDETGIYTEILTSIHGCDSTVTLDLTVLPIPTGTMNAEICEGESYLFDGQNLTETGTYSMMMEVTNGCDSLLILELLVLENETTTLNETVCEGEIFELGDSFYDETGIYTTTLPADNGCSNFVTLNLTVLPKSETQLVENICEGESIAVGNNNYNTSGDFEINLTAANGCDSTVFLTLTVLPVAESNLNEVICAGENVTVGTMTFSETGNYEVILTGENGCDSVVNLQLNVIENEVTNLTESICEGESYALGGQIFTETGMYSVEVAVNDCASIFNLDLTVLANTETDLVETVCEGETFQIGNSVFTETGNYAIILENNNGCDSTVNLNLTVLNNEMTELTETICAGDSYTLEGNIFTDAGQYSVELVSNNGCLNLVNLTLEVTELMTETVTQQICEGESFTIGTETFSETGNYSIELISAAGCDSLVNLNLTILDLSIENLEETICEGETFEVGSLVFTETGNYEVNLTTVSGCDSLVNLNLSIDNNPTPIITGVTEICDGDTAILTVETDDNQTILWSNNATTPTIEIMESGTYSVVTTSPNGCTKTASWMVEMTVLPMPEILTQTQPSGCGAMDGLLEIGANGATDLLYSIDGGTTWQNDGVFDSLEDGLYEIVVANASENCTQAFGELVELLSPESIDIEEVTLQLPTNCDNDNGSILITTAMNGTYQYSVDNGQNWQSSNEFTNLSVGNYTVLVSNVDGTCETAYPESLTIETVEAVVLATTDILPIACHDEENGQIFVAATGGTGDLNYAWSTGQTGQSLNDLAAGNYALTVTDANDCTEIFAFSIDNPALFTVDIVDNQEMKYCANETAILTIENTDLAVEWTNDNGFSSTDPTVEVTEGGVYVVTATNMEGCVATDEVLVEFSEEAVEANFLLPAEGLIEKAIVVADISWPIPDSIQWDFDTDKIELIRYEENQAIFTFPEIGTFEIEMTAFRGDCSVTLTKSITLFDNEDDLTNPDNLQPGFTQILEFNMIPNPNDGNFVMRISFSQEDSATFYIFSENGNLVKETALTGSYFYIQAYSLDVAPGVYTAVLRRGTEFLYFNFVVF